jgi:predicted RNase H-like HicB family nuclease
MLTKADIPVEVPSLPGCFSQGETIDESMNNVKEAIELHIQGLKDEGHEVPTEKDLVIGRVEVKAASRRPISIYATLWWLNFHGMATSTSAASGSE